MKQQFFAILSALLASDVLGQTFEVNGGNPLTIKNANWAGLAIPIKLKTAHSAPVIVFFDTLPTLNLQACQLTFPAYSAEQTQSITVYPNADIDESLVYQITMSIFLTTTQGGDCVITWLPIVLKPIFVPHKTYNKWCNANAFRHIDLPDGVGYDYWLNPGKQGITWLKSVDGITVVQAFQSTVGSTNFISKLAIKHYDSVIVLTAPDLNTGATEVSVNRIIGTSEQTLMPTNCMKQSADGIIYRCELYLTNGGFYMDTYWKYGYDGPNKFVYCLFNTAIPIDYENKITGLCGNNNDDPNDDGVNDMGYSDRQSFSLGSSENLAVRFQNSPDFNYAPPTPNGGSFIPLGATCPAKVQPPTCSRVIRFNNKCNA